MYPSAPSPPPPHKQQQQEFSTKVNKKLAHSEMTVKPLQHIIWLKNTREHPSTRCERFGGGEHFTTALK